MDGYFVASVPRSSAYRIICLVPVLLFSSSPGAAFARSLSSTSSFSAILLLLLGGLLLVAGCDTSVDLQQNESEPTARTVPADSSGLALTPMPTGSELLMPGEPAPKSNADASAYGCYLASQPYSEEVAFHSQYLHFPASIIDEAGDRTRIIARYMAASASQSNEVGVRYATCVIPDADGAESLVEDQLLYAGIGQATGNALQSAGVLSKSACVLITYNYTCVGLIDDPPSELTCRITSTDVTSIPCPGDDDEDSGFPDDPGEGSGGGGTNDGPGDDGQGCDTGDGPATEPIENPPPGSSCEPADPCEGDDPPAHCDEEEFPCELSTSDLDDENLFAAASEEDLEAFIETIEEYGTDFGLDTPEQVQHFLGQIAHEAKLSTETSARITVAEESGVFTNIWDTKEKLRENSNYIGPDAEYAAEDVLGNAELIANIMRANKYGNGGPSSGDGWAYRGRGPVQLTWKGAYQNFTNFYQNEEYGTEDFAENPEQLSNDAEAGTLAALWFWDNRVMTHPSIDEDDLTVEDVTEAINGPGKRGLEEREDRTEAAENNIDCSN